MRATICPDMNVKFKTLTALLAFLCDFVLTKNDVRRPPSTIMLHVKKTQETFLYCFSEGTPEVNYAWKLNGENLFTNLTPMLFVEFQNKKYSVTTTVSGFYQCIASNQYGTALSSVIPIQIPIKNRFRFTNPVINNIIVAEGRPFVIPADRSRSHPGNEYLWYIAVSDDDKHPRQLRQSGRMQFAFNGDLYLAYAVKEDEIGGKLYRNTAYELYTNFSGRTYTRLTVTNDSESLSEFPPSITYFSKSQDVALIGRSIQLKCFASGKPLPDITWSRIGIRSLPSRRNNISYFGTELTISDITEPDEGEYVCTATNALGSTRKTLNFFVEAEPSFIRDSDRLHDVNVTEGESITVNCSAFAKPEATVAWFRNGQPIDIRSPPTRFTFSSDNRRLTIANVCRDCDDRETKTDLMVIQCNASNVHGYAFASGYLNVLLQTNVTIIGPDKVSVDFLDKKILCLATSDPSTPPTVLWYKTGPYDDLVRDEPPYVYVRKEILLIMFHPNCSVCAKYLGEYKCIGDNGYSQANSTITISHQLNSLTSSVMQNEEPFAVWKIILGAGAIGLTCTLFLIGLYLCSKRRVNISKKQSKNRKLSKRPRRRDSVEHPAGSIDDQESSLPRPISIYDKIGYETIDQLLEEMGNSGGAMPPSVNSTPVHLCKRYESMDVPTREVDSTGRPMLNEDTTYDQMGFPIALKDVTNSDGKNQNEGNGYESVRIEARGLPNSNTQFEAINTYTDLKRRKVNSCLNQGQAEGCPHLEAGSEEMNTYFDVSRKDTDMYKNTDKADEDETLCMTSDPKAETLQCKEDYLVLNN